MLPHILLRGIAAAFIFALPATAQICDSTITFTGQPQIGTSVQVQLNGVPGCHACTWVSKNPGPVQFGNTTIPIGLPLLNFFDFGVFGPTGQVTEVINIPNDPNIVGLQFFFTNVGFPQGQSPTLQNVRLSPAAVLTIQP